MSLKNILFPCCFYVVFLSTLITLIPISESQIADTPRQYVNFYSQVNCSNSSFIATVWDSTLLNSTLSNASSLAINGLWVIEYNNTNNLTEAHRLQGDCISSISSKGEYRRVIRIGDENQSGMDFFLYEDKYFRGSGYKVEAPGINFNKTMYFNSWFFTGSNLWTIYSGTNYSGNSTCLVPDHLTVSMNQGFKHNENGLTPVGSVKYACNHQPSSAVSTFQGLSVISVAKFILPLYAAFASLQKLNQI